MFQEQQRTNDDDAEWISPRVKRTVRIRTILDEADVEIAGLCMSDNCSVLGVHAAHPVSAREDKLVYTRLSTIQDYVFKHVGDREARMLGQIYQDVVNDYGDVQIRVVQRALQQLSIKRQIVMVTPRGARGRHRSLERMVGAYVRWTSPLLFDPDGVLFDQAEDLIKARGRIVLTE